MPESDVDDQSQLRIRLEAAAVAHILERVELGIDDQVSSQIAVIEIEANIDAVRRRRVASLLPERNLIIPLDDHLFARAESLRPLGLKFADALHVASAERAGADVLLTCDDRLLRAARRHRDDIRVHVTSPIVWMEERDETTNT